MHTLASPRCGSQRSDSCGNPAARYCESSRLRAVFLSASTSSTHTRSWSALTARRHFKRLWPTEKQSESRLKAQPSTLGVPSVARSQGPEPLCTSLSMWAKFCCQDLSEQPQTGCWSLAHHGYQLPSASAAGLRLPPWKHEGGRQGSEVAVVWVRGTDPKAAAAAAPFDVSLLRIRPHAAELPTLTSPSGPRGPCHAWQPAQRPGVTPMSPNTASQQRARAAWLLRAWSRSHPRGAEAPSPRAHVVATEGLMEHGLPPRSHPATCLRSSPASAAGRGFSSVPRSCN